MPPPLTVYTADEPPLEPVKKKMSLVCPECKTTFKSKVKSGYGRKLVWYITGSDRSADARGDVCT